MTMTTQILTSPTCRCSFPQMHIFLLNNSALATLSPAGSDPARHVVTLQPIANHTGLIPWQSHSERRERHTACRGYWRDEGMGARRRHLSRIPAIRQCSEETAKLEEPINKGGCNGLRILFSDEVKSMKDLIPLLWIQTRCCRDTEWKCLQAAVWKRLLCGVYLQNF